jgi:hemolysin-activating ACP:hemolysin acyltransferase
MTFEVAQAETSNPSTPVLNSYKGTTTMPPASAQEKNPARSADARQARVAQAFSQIVAVLMRDPVYKNLKIADLEHLVLPPVLAGQFRLALGTRQADAGKEQKGGIYIPVAVALWARVSPKIDKALSENLDKPMWLRPQEWTSGDIPWLMAAAGNPRALQTFLKQLAEKDFQGQQVKMRVRGPDGKAVVKVLGQ